MDRKRKKQLRKFSRNIGWTGGDIDLLNQALTHATFFEGQQPENREDNQRLEFLGDAVLDLLIGEWVYKNYPREQEGVLSKMRAAVVCETALAKQARKINLGSFLLLGKGSEKNGDRERDSILADALEAVIGAYYLAKGIKATQIFVMKVMKDNLRQLSKGEYDDFKSMLQHLLQSYGSLNAVYKVLKATGPAHERHYKVGAFYKRKMIGRGEGSSKKIAEQNAAKEAWRNRNKWMYLVKARKNA